MSLANLSILVFSHPLLCICAPARSQQSSKWDNAFDISLIFCSLLVNQCWSPTWVSDSGVSRKDGPAIRDPWRYCSLRIWERHQRRAWWSCSSVTDPWIWERRSLWTFLILPRREANPMCGHLLGETHSTSCTQFSFTHTENFLNIFPGPLK